jgi:Phage integrase family
MLPTPTPRSAAMRVQPTPLARSVAILFGSQPLKDIAQIILDTGLRPEEVFRIRIENIDFGERAIFNPFGKTKAARRKVTANVGEILKRRTKKPKSPFVFPSRGNLDRPIGSVRKRMTPQLRRHQRTFQGFTICGTHFRLAAVAAGVDLPALSAILGHTSIQMTMRYVHPAEEQKRFAAGKLVRLAGMVESDGKESARHYNFRYCAMREKANAYNSDMVGAPGFEPGTSCAQGRRATRLRYAPT